MPIRILSPLRYTVLTIYVVPKSYHYRAVSRHYYMTLNTEDRVEAKMMPLIHSARVNFLLEFGRLKVRSYRHRDLFLAVDIGSSTVHVPYTHGDAVMLVNVMQCDQAMT